ncbi:MAG: hypothetical protein QOJ60_45, partial [Actinomycetota bacterium]|nr:hypothetical protein [Actinomycetota bacterium]
MPEGALLTGTVESVLLDLAERSATGCLVVRDQEGDEAEVFLRDGLVYSVFVPGRRTMLGVRLMSRGALTPEALAEALEIQKTELQGWRLGELLVHLGYVDLAVVEEFVVEHLKDAMADLLGWPVEAWKFRKNKKTRQDVAPPTSVESLLSELHARATTWDTIDMAIGGANAVPTLSSEVASDDVALGPNEWALLCKVDGERNVAELAAECGFTLFEAGQVVNQLLAANLLSVPERTGAAELVLPVVPLDEAGPDPGPAPVDDSVQVDDPTPDEAEPAAAEASEQVAAAETELLAREQAERAAAQDAERAALEDAELTAATALAEATEVERRQRAADEEVERRQRAADEEAQRAQRAAAESSRVANDRLHEAEIIHREMEALAAKEAEARKVRKSAREKERHKLEEEMRRFEETGKRSRHESERAQVEAAAWVEHGSWMTAERRRVEQEAWAAHHHYLDAQRAAVESEAWVAHVMWLATARAEAEGTAWDEHREWESGRRAIDEPAAWAGHAQWLNEQRAAVEEEAWAEHLAFLEAARRAVEEEAWSEHHAWLQELAALEEAERAVAEEVERVAREEAERAAAEEAERAAAVEAERVAAEEAERAAAEEAERVAAEEADRAAAEEAERAAAAQEAEHAAAQEAER